MLFIYLFANKVNLAISLLLPSAIDKRNSVLLALLKLTCNTFKCEIFTSLVNQDREKDSS